MIGNVERTGLRYINLFEFPLIDKINVKIKLIDHQISHEPTNLRIEFEDGEYRKILQIGNQVEVTVDNQGITGSVIDIDCIRTSNYPGDRFFSEYRDMVETAHNKEKELFFSLLRDDFVETLNPEYEE